MSLHAAAQHLAAHGRGGDTQLVHMTPGEVRSLQDLAKAHGGSLTTNPHTGLPEASFLSSILPLAAGAASTYFTGSPYAGMALAGGLTYAQSGSLTKGLMAGLGAYGGGQLAAGLGGVGASEFGGDAVAAAEAKGQQAVQEAMAGRAQQMEAAKAAMPDAWGKLDAMAMPQPLTEAERQAAFGKGFMGYTPPETTTLQNMQRGIGAVIDDPTKLKNVGGGWTGLAKIGGAALAPSISEALQPKPLAPLTTTAMPNPVYTYNRGTATPMPTPNPLGIEQEYFPTAGYTRIAAEGGVMRMAEGGPAIQGMPAPGHVEQMSLANSVGQNTGYPQAGINRGAYATPWQTPISRNMLEGAADTGVNPITGSMNFASGGLSDLGSYSDGGRLLRGPGDGVSDSIPAVIGKKQPARLADGEFVVPARIVSEIGNGSTEAGARKLYAMMDRVQSARGKTVGKGKVAKNTRADKYLPA